MSVKNRIRHALLLRSICCLGVAISLFFSFTSCMDELKNYEAELKAIHFVKVDKEDVTLLSDTVRPSTTSVPVSVSHDADLKSLVPIIEASFGATTSVESGKPYDFSNPVTISISSEDGKKRREYRIQVTKRDAPPVIAVVDPRNSEAMLENLAFTNIKPDTIIVRGSTIRVLVPIGTELTNLVPTFTISPGATASFTSGESYNFTYPLAILVTSENEQVRRVYAISVQESDPELSPDAMFTAFEILNSPYDAEIVGSEIFCYVPSNTDLTRILPGFDLSDGATCSIKSGRRLDYTKENPFKITVTSQDSTSTSVYTLILERKRGHNAVVESISIEGVGEADLSDSQGYTFYLKDSKDVTSLVPVVKVGESGTCSLTPDQPLDFTNPQKFTVTSEDGSTRREFTIRVIPFGKAQPGDGELNSFSFINAPSETKINGLDVYVRVPLGTDLTSLIAEFTFVEIPLRKKLKFWIGSREIKSGETALDYSSPVKLEAWRAIWRANYTIHVEEVPLEATPVKLISFSFKDIDAQVKVRGERVEIDVPKGTDLTRLIPQYQLSDGVAANIPAGQAHDFSSPVKFVLTSADGTSTVTYSIKVTPKENNQAEITDFKFAEIPNVKYVKKGTELSFYAGTDVDATQLTPQYELSRGAKADLANGITADFSSPVPVRVESEDGSISRSFKIKVIQQKNFEAEILSFRFKEMPGVNLNIDGTNIIFPAPSSAVDLTSLTPIFEISPGATASIQSGVPADFSQPVKIAVTSEDQSATNIYIVRKEQEGIKYDFEKWSTLNPSDPYDQPDGGWSSSNVGMATARSYSSRQKPARYPVRKVKDAHGGQYAAAISTERLEMNGNPIAAGALFLGSFNGSVVLTTPLAAPQFGVAWAGGASMPDRFKGWYKYKSGAVITNKSNLKTDKDEMSIYAVLYYGPTLTGKDKDFRNYDRVIAIAEIEDRTPKRDWTYFDLEFKPKNPLPQGETPRFSIVFSSSLYGSTFEGAIGSELVVDDLEITLK